MLSLDLVLSLLLLAAFHAVLVLAIPFVPLAAGSRLINMAQEARLPITPMVETLALVLGVVIGAFLLAYNLPQGSLTLAGLFDGRGYWTISLDRFLLERVNPLNYSLAEVLLPNAELGGLQPLLLPAATALLVMPLLIQRGPAGLANGARNLLILVWAAYATVYLVCLLYWLLALLNFWAFLVALLLIQNIRR